MTTAQLLHEAGLRRTRAREAVLLVLNQANRPHSHHEIAGKPGVSNLDRVTLYRTLTTLQQAGLLHRIQGVDGVWRYRGHDVRTGKCAGNHIHFLCLDCNRMSCLPEQPLPWVKEPAGSDVYGKQLVVYGRCPECKSEIATGEGGGNLNNKEPNRANGRRSYAPPSLTGDEDD